MSVRRAAGVVLVALVASAACSTREVDDDSSFDALVAAGPVVIPLSGAADGEAEPLDEYYRSIVAQLQESFVERDADRLDALLASHDRAIAPDWAAEALASFRRVSAALRTELWCEANAELALRGAAPALGDVVPLVLRIPPGGAPDCAFPGVGEEIAPTHFLVAVRYVDRDCFGAESVASAQDLLTLPVTVELARQGLELPFDVPALPPSGCERRLELRCELLPGARLVAAEEVPGQWQRLASLRLELYPRGIERVHAAPLATLRAALDAREPRFFDHVWLASRAMPPAERLAADELLIVAVRLGPPDQALVAGACLREASGASLAPSDREGWLGWWQARRRVGSDDASRATRR